MGDKKKWDEEIVSVWISFIVFVLSTYGIIMWIKSLLVKP